MRMQRCTLKHFTKFLENKGLARAWLSTLERTCRQRISARAWLTSLERTAKVLDACYSRSMGDRPPLERETQVLARAYIPSLKWTINTCKVLDTRISRSSVTLLARADYMNLECMLEREVPRSSMDPKSGISKFVSKHETQHSTHQNSTSWAHFLEEHFKPII